MRLKQWILIGCIGLIFFLGACSDKGKEGDKTSSKTGAEDIFSYVPSESPYVFGNLKPMPKAYLNKMIGMWQKMQPSYAKMMEMQSQSAEKPAEKVIMKLSQAILTEMAAIKTIDDIQSQLGLSSETTSVFYGLGLLPSGRIQIADKAKVEQLLTRLEEKSGQKMSTAELNGQAYRFTEIKDEVHLKAILSVTDDYLIFGVVPGKQADFDQFLPLLLGANKPETALSRSDFKAKLSQYQYPGYGDGYADIQQIAAVLRGEGEGLNLASFKALAPEPDFKLQIGCNTDFNRSFFSNIPRLIFGMNTVTETTFDMEMVLELSTGLIETFKKLPQSIPNITEKTEPMFALGIGANIPELRMSIQRLIQYIIDNNQDCPEFDTAKLKEIMPKLNMALNPMISGLQSIVFSLDHLETDENGQPAMDTVGACLALEMNDPQGLVAMGAAFVPSLANLNIPSDGTAVAIPLDGLPLPIPGLYAAIKDKRLVLSMGKEAETRAQGAIGGEGIADRPLVWSTYQTSAWEQFLKSGLNITKQMDKADQDTIMEMFEQYKEMFKSIGGGIYVTDKGLSFREKVIFN